jgi:aspartate beta-hydroxylase
MMTQTRWRPFRFLLCAALCIAARTSSAIVPTPPAVCQQDDEVQCALVTAVALLKHEGTRQAVEAFKILQPVRSRVRSAHASSLEGHLSSSGAFGLLMKALTGEIEAEKMRSNSLVRTASKHYRQATERLESIPQASLTPAAHRTIQEVRTALLHRLIRLRIFVVNLRAASAGLVSLLTLRPHDPELLGDVGTLMLKTPGSEPVEAGKAFRDMIRLYEPLLAAEARAKVEAAVAAGSLFGLDMGSVASAEEPAVAAPTAEARRLALLRFPAYPPGSDPETLKRSLEQGARRLPALERLGLSRRSIAEGAAAAVRAARSGNAPYLTVERILSEVGIAHVHLGYVFYTQGDESHSAYLLAAQHILHGMRLSPHARTRRWMNRLVEAVNWYQGTKKQAQATPPPAAIGAPDTSSDVSFHALPDAALDAVKAEASAVAAQMGLWPAPGQRPSHVTHQELRARPFWSPAPGEDRWPDGTATMQALARALEDSWADVTREALSAMRRRAPPAAGEAGAGAAEWNQTGGAGWKVESARLHVSGNWQEFSIFVHGEEVRENCKAAPVTCSIARNFPDVSGCKMGQVKFSLMLPGTHVRAHVAPSNTRIRNHFGLVIPEGVRIRVGDETRTWEEGKMLSFDDSFEHEVWHEGDQPRLIAIFDMWHPDLKEPLKKRITMKQIDRNNQQYFAGRSLDDGGWGVLQSQEWL